MLTVPALDCSSTSSPRVLAGGSSQDQHAQRRVSPRAGRFAGERGDDSGRAAHSVYRVADGGPDRFDATTALIMFGAWRLVRESIDILLNRRPRTSLPAVRGQLEAIPGIESVRPACLT